MIKGEIDVEIKKNYLINSGCLWGLYCFVQVINLKYLENLVVRKIEKGDEK